MNNTAKGKSQKVSKKHPWKRHNPHFFAKTRAEAIDRYTADNITAWLKKKVKKGTGGTHVKPC